MCRYWSYVNSNYHFPQETSYKCLTKVKLPFTMSPFLKIPFVCLALFFSQVTLAQDYKVIKSCKGYYKPLEDLPDSVILKRIDPKFDPEAEKKLSYELLPVNTRVRRLEGIHIYRVKVLTGLFKGKLLYLKPEFLIQE